MISGIRAFILPILMILKVECALDVVKHSVNTALIVDRRVALALRVERLTDARVGTQIRV